jgi:hypothetical protein
VWSADGPIVSSTLGQTGLPGWRFRAVVALAFVLPLRIAAHDIPNDVAIQAFFKPEPGRARLLVRVPLKAMRDFVFPERGPGYLDFDHVDPQLPNAAKQWISDSIDLFEGEVRLPKPQIVATRLSLESDRSFESYDQALRHFNEPRLTNETTVVWNQTLLDVLFEYPIRSEAAEFSILPSWGRLGIRVVTALRFLTPEGFIRAFEFEGDPGLVRLDPRWYQAAARFIQSGFMHILDGADHLLFLVCLVIPFRKLRPLILVVTAFTVAHSVTLIASAYDLAPGALWFPPLVETLIAVSIVYMAFENIVGASDVQRRWLITFGFGLIHGFGFSFALRQTLQFAGSHMLTSLLSFNMGVELGQLLVLAILIPVLNLLFRFVVAERMGTIILSALVAHTGWHWMSERWEQLRQYRFSWPEFNAAFAVTALHWAMAVVFLAGVLWLFSAVMRQRSAQRSGESQGKLSS